MKPPVVVLTGAGMSTEAGIPDFRSKGGLWDRFDPMEFTIERFWDDPDRFWRRRARLIAAMDYLDAEPTAAHKALAEATRDGRITMLITQNVDGLHRIAGTPEERLLEVHGNGRRTRCTHCGAAEDVQVTLARWDHETAPKCQECSGVLKPDVVLFGEPVHLLDQAIAAVEGAGTLVVAGTSLQVYPVAGLVGAALDTGADVVLCNRDETRYDRRAAAIYREPLGVSIPRLFPRGGASSFSSALQ